MKGLIGWEAELSLLLDRSLAPHGADSAFGECVQSNGYQVVESPGSNIGA